MKYTVHVVYREQYEYENVSEVDAIDIARKCVADNHGYDMRDRAQFYVVRVPEENFIPPYGDLSDAGMDGA